MKKTQIVYIGPFPEVVIDHPTYGQFTCKRDESVAVPEPLAAELTAAEVKQKVTAGGKTTEEILKREKLDWRLATIDAPKPHKSK